MKKILLFASLLFFSTLSATSSVYFGVHHNYTRIKFNNPSKLEGYLTGVELGYEYQRCGYFGDLNFEGYWNPTDITGHTCQKSSVTEYVTTLKTGISYCLCDRFIFKPYLGFGYNCFKNDQDPDSDGLTYRYRKLFIPVGLYSYWQITNKTALGLQAEWRPDVYSRLKVASSHINLHCSHAFRIQLPLILQMCQSCYRLNITPFYDWNRFGKTSEENSRKVCLPISSLIRWNLGLRLSLCASF